MSLQALQTKTLAHPSDGSKPYDGFGASSRIFKISIARLILAFKMANVKSLNRLKWR